MKVIQRKPFTTEDTEKLKKQTGLLCALCVSSERNERVVKRIINPDNSYWSEVDNWIIFCAFPYHVHQLLVVGRR